MHQVTEGNVKYVAINGTEVKGEYTNKNATFQTLDSGQLSSDLRQAAREDTSSST